jgi:uncharacterized protein YciI
LSAIDATMKAHVAWLSKHYDAGTFVVSGRKVPRDGGIILAVGHDRAKIEQIVAADPFVSGLPPVTIRDRGRSRSGDARARGAHA